MRLHAQFCTQTIIPTRYHIKHIHLTPDLFFNSLWVIWVCSSFRIGEVVLIEISTANTVIFLKQGLDIHIQDDKPRVHQTGHGRLPQRQPMKRCHQGCT